MSGRLVKSVVIGALVVGASYYYSYLCHQVYQSYDTLSSNPGTLLPLVLQVLLAIGLVLLTAGIAATLLRPLRALLVVFVVSSATLLLSLGLSVGSGVLALLFLAVATLYSRGVANEMNNRLRFSLRPISESQSALILGLVLVVSASLYLGYAPKIEAESFSIPPAFAEAAMSRAVKDLEGMHVDAPPEQRAVLLAESKAQIEAQIKEVLGQVESAMRPFQKFISIGLAVVVFITLLEVVTLLAWLPVLILGPIFAVCRLLGITGTVTETREVQRMVLV